MSRWFSSSASGGETTTSYRRVSVPGGPAPPESYHHEDRTDVVAESFSGSDLADSGCDLFLADACVGLVVSVCQDEKHPKRAYFQEARLVPADAWSPAAQHN